MGEILAVLCLAWILGGLVASWYLAIRFVVEVFFELLA